jgi:hypothetical protein
MQIIVLEARTVKGDPNSLILSFDINGVKRPARLKQVFNTVRALKGRQVTPERLLALFSLLVD